jgi:hypothetical protein
VVKSLLQGSFGVNKNAPFLSGFSTLLSGSSKRSKHALLNQQRSRLIASQLSDYALQFEPFIDPALVDSFSQTHRKQYYDNVTTFWAWLSQIIEQNAYCSKAVSMVPTWCSQADRPVAMRTDSRSFAAWSRTIGEVINSSNEASLSRQQNRGLALRRPVPKATNSEASIVEALSTC